MLSLGVYSLILWCYKNLTYAPVLIIWLNIRQFTNDRRDWEEYYSLLLIITQGLESDEDTRNRVRVYGTSSRYFMN